MNCDLHKDKVAIKKCKVCRKPMCESCAEISDNYGACPTCSVAKIKNEKENYKKGLIFNVLSVLMFVAYVVLFAVNLATQKLKIWFIIVGSIVGVLVGIWSISLLVINVLRINRNKKLVDLVLANNEEEIVQKPKIIDVKEINQENLIKAEPKQEKSKAKSKTTKKNESKTNKK